MRVHAERLSLLANLSRLPNIPSYEGELACCTQAAVKDEHPCPQMCKCHCNPMWQLAKHTLIFGILLFAVLILALASRIFRCSLLGAFFGGQQQLRPLPLLRPSSSWLPAWHPSWPSLQLPNPEQPEPTLMPCQSCLAVDASTHQTNVA